MSHKSPEPDSPDPGAPGPASGRSGLAGPLVALESALYGLAQSAEAEDSAQSLRRITRALVEGGTLAARPELAAAASSVLGAEAGALADAARRLTTLLAQAVAAHTTAKPDLVLIVEDDTTFARALEAQLATTSAKVVVVETAAAARALLKREAVSLVVLDLILPDSDGRNILLELRSDPRTAGIPVFVVSARLGMRTKAECFALGADAYFEKPLDLQAFAIAVGSRLDRAEGQAQFICRDPVTGLPNRAAFLQACSRLRDEAPKEAFALAVLDLDHFQWIEETWGRQFSESVLHRAGACLAEALPQASVFARWDGAEFIALFAGHGATEIGAVVDQALAALRKLDFREGQVGPLAVTFSAGVVDAPGNQTMDDTLALADRLRHAAKTSGRNRVMSGEVNRATPAPRILLAEDDPHIVGIVSRHLEREGFEVVAFPDGAKALANAATSGAALIISDVEMPNLDGLALLQGLRTRPEFRHIPIMMLTAMGDERYVVRAFELGADDYVIKPFSMREVTARVRRLLRRPSIAGVPAVG